MDNDSLILDGIKLTGYFVDIHDDNIVIMNEHNTGNIMFNEFVEEVNNIFGFYTNDVCDTWFEKRVLIVTKDIQDYLLDYRVSLGVTNWLVTHKDGSTFNINRMKIFFMDKYSDKFIHNIYNDWRMKKMISYGCY
jgi:hypothetical protein